MKKKLLNNHRIRRHNLSSHIKPLPVFRTTSPSPSSIGSHFCEPIHDSSAIAVTQSTVKVMFEERNHKKRKLCEEGSSVEDRISELPEDLIRCHILSRLRTIDTVKTSLLSTKWINLWKSVPELALHSRKFSTVKDLASFINKFFYIHKDSLSIRKFQLRVNVDHYIDYEWLRGLIRDDKKGTYASQWIDVLTNHNIQHLDFSFGNFVYIGIQIPLSLYTCETLVHLRLVGIRMVDSDFVSLPCLRSIHFRFVKCPNRTVLEKLISSSLVLEDLTILRALVSNEDAKPLLLQSQTLERIYIDSLSYGIKVVVIDAPLLQCLKIKLDLCGMTRIIYSGLSPTLPVHVKLKACFFFGNPDKISMILHNLTIISIMLEDLVITRNAFKSFHRFSNVESLPQFCRMSCLNVNLFVSELKWFPTFLESCPNLKFLSMEWHATSKKKKKKYIRFESVPKCLSSSLECVDIKTMVSEDAIEVKVVKYFLDNAVILKKLTLQLDSHPRKNDIFNKIIKFPRCSIASQLVLL